MRKVSVVVATFNSPRGALALLLDSLDAQTMPTEDFEVIFVDDGSTDDTVAQLSAIAAARPNVRVERIENSGWPSRPRNIGIDLADGEYILFMDHDDQLYPDALRAGYAFARANSADVLNGKEAYTHTPHWALSTYTEDLPQTPRDHGGHALLPMNPHKLYRRAFLLTHGIRFREGRKVLWEDQFFNVQVARHASVISTLSSTPFYHWVYTKGSGSTLFVKATDDYWMWFRRLLTATVEELSEGDLVAQREALLRHQYGARVLGPFDAKFARRPQEEQEFLFAHARAIQRDFSLERFTSELSASSRRRAEVLAHGEVATMAELCAVDAEPVADAEATSVRWIGGQLHVSANVSWSHVDGTPLAYRVAGGALTRGLPAELAERTPSARDDLRAELSDASVDLSVRSRASRIVWLTPSTAPGGVTVEEEEDGGAVALQGRVETVIDPATGAMGGGLETGHWDLFVRAVLGSWVSQRALRSDIPAAVTLTDGRLHLVYASASRSTTLIPDGATEAIRRLVPSRARQVGPGRIEVELAGEHDGGGRVTARIGIAGRGASAPGFREIDATVRVADGRAFVRFAARTGDRVRLGDRATDGVAWWQVGGERDGIVPLLPKGQPSPEAVRARILVISQRDDDDVVEQGSAAGAEELVRLALDHAGYRIGEYTLTHRAAAGLLPRPASRDTAAARKAIAAADVVVLVGGVALPPLSARGEAIVALCADLDVPLVYASTAATATAATVDPVAAVVGSRPTSGSHRPVEGRIAVVTEGRPADRARWEAVLTDVMTNGREFDAFTTGRPIDELALTELAATTRLPASHVTGAITSFDEFCALIQKSDLVVTSNPRVHLVAHALGVATLSLPADARDVSHALTRGADDGAAERIQEDADAALRDAFGVLARGLVTALGAEPSDSDLTVTELRAALSSVSVPSLPQYRERVRRKFRHEYAARLAERSPKTDTAKTTASPSATRPSFVRRVVRAVRRRLRR